MALQQIDGELNAPDKRQVISFGTMGGDHMALGSVQAKHMNQVILPFDTRVVYLNGPLGGWSIVSVANGGFFRFGQAAFTNFAGASLTVNFSGTKIAIYGALREDAGRFDCYLDGVLYNGVLPVSTSLPLTIPAGQQSAPSTSTIKVLAPDATTITVASATVIDTFAGGINPKMIRMEDELIQYTSADATNFYGCSRGVAGTTPAIHTVGTTVYAIGSTVDAYSAYREYRQRLWMADRLQPGTHTLTIQVRADKSPSANNTYAFIDSFAVGDIISGPSLNLNTQVVPIGSVILSGSPVTPVLVGAAGDYINTDQLVGFVGITDDSHRITYQVTPDGSIWISAPTAGTYNNVLLTAMVAGDVV